MQWRIKCLGHLWSALFVSSGTDFHLTIKLLVHTGPNTLNLGNRMVNLTRKSTQLVSENSCELFSMSIEIVTGIPEKLIDRWLPVEQSVVDSNPLACWRTITAELIQIGAFEICLSSFVFYEQWLKSCKIKSLLIPTNRKRLQPDWSNLKTNKKVFKKDLKAAERGTLTFSFFDFSSVELELERARVFQALSFVGLWVSSLGWAWASENWAFELGTYSAYYKRNDLLTNLVNHVSSSLQENYPRACLGFELI